MTDRDENILRAIEDVLTDSKPGGVTARELAEPIYDRIIEAGMMPPREREAYERTIQIVKSAGTVLAEQEIERLREELRIVRRFLRRVAHYAGINEALGEEDGR